MAHHHLLPIVQELAACTTLLLQHIRSLESQLLAEEEVGAEPSKLAPPNAALTRVEPFVTETPTAENSENDAWSRPGKSRSRSQRPRSQRALASQMRSSRCRACRSEVFLDVEGTVLNEDGTEHKQTCTLRRTLQRAQS